MTESRPPSDEEIDRLLASRYRDTTPEFEARWRDLRRDLRRAPVRQPGFAWRGWPVVLAAGGVALVVVLALHPGRKTVPPPAVHFSPAFAELAEMDEILGAAAPLLDPENRAALLHLPVQPPPHT